MSGKDRWRIVSHNKTVADTFFNGVPQRAELDTIADSDCKTFTDGSSSNKPQLVGNEFDDVARAARASVNNESEVVQYWCNSSNRVFISTNKECELSVSCTVNRAGDRAVDNLNTRRCSRSNCFN